MEFLESNYLDTSTAIVVNSNTITAQYLLDPALVRQWISASYNDDSLTSQVTIQFSETLTVDRIAILDHNAKSMRIFYNGVTANAFALSGSGASYTTTSDWTTNSQSSMYLRTTPVACTSVTFDLRTTMLANSEKAIGHIIISQQELDFSRIPSAGDYTPVKKAKELQHELSTGGLRTHFVAGKADVKIKFKYITQTFRDQLEAIYDQHEAKIFVPFGTATAWDEIIFECNWYGNFDFYKFSDNAVASGFTGSINLRET